jgi:hypothetical protein
MVCNLQIGAAIMRSIASDHASVEPRQMKKAIVLIISFLTLSSAAFAASVPGSLGYGNGVNDNPHNLSSLSTATISAPLGGEEQICIFCHTPHGASAQSTLWNRPDLYQADSSYPLYSGPLVINETLPGSPGGSLTNSQYTKDDPAIQYPNGSSRMCMSCHDGVTAIGTVLNGGELATLSMSATGTIDLLASHPISFVYNAAVVGNINFARGPEYREPPNALLAPRDGNSRMQCTTCHEPHFDTRHDNSYPYPFWRNAGRGVPAGSAADYNLTCDQCHLSPPFWDPVPLPRHGDGLDQFGNPL